MNDQMMEEIFLDTASLNGIKSSEKIEKFRKKFFELIDVVDEQGNIIGTTLRGFAHRVGLRHFTVNVFIRDKNNLLLLQQRTAGIDNIAKRLDISAAGHVKAGTTEFREEAVRELEEELGTKLEAAALIFVTKCNRNSPFNILKPFERNLEHRILFEYVVNDTEKAELERKFHSRTGVDEVSAMAWYTAQEVAEKIQSGFAADGLAGTFPQYISYLLRKTE